MNESEGEKYESLIRYTSDVVSVLAMDGTIRYVSPSVERVLGYEPDDLVDTNAFDSIHPDDRERVWTAFERVLDDSEDVIEPVEYRFARGGDTWVWVESTGSVYPESAVDGFVVSTRDITERKRREAELEAERRRFQSLTEGVSAIVYRADPVTLDTTYVNDTIEEITGYTPEEWTSDPTRFEDAIHPDDREFVLDELRRLQADHAADSIDYRLVTRGGDVRWIRDQISWERDADGDVTAQIGVASDITEMKEYQSRIEETAAKLETLNRVVRHDIRNDMTIILGWAELLEDHVDETGVEYLEKILASGEQVVDLTNSVRDYVETVTNGDAMAVKPTPLRYVLETEISLRRESFPEASFSVDGEIPDVEVAGNEMLASVFRNLLNNAVQHNDDPSPSVEISVADESESVVVTVADNGPGLPEELSRRLFAEGEKGLESGGTGMGLFLVRRLVDGFGGEVWAENRDAAGDGGGAAFHVRLPKA
ncbi:PAS domain-containing sensor histidine kinase [Halocalculus aciditolerans]|uniref:histidine kinase n=1 Tax=Halocalculus aciditolerans TaxID=1383812 RepID=A0A830F6R9_9EURY|nr:PAS domain-containing sensor histidine kinase [Halocalculus aciditolerans]GGL68967.1 hypothetical protein GCM10009039_28680 [Halocalculus aciditolerans]